MTQGERKAEKARSKRWLVTYSTDESVSSDNALDAYQRFARHERSLWFTTIAVIVMNAATIAILTIGAAFSGAFEGSFRGFLLASASFLLIAIFIAYVGVQRQGLEENRARILKQLESHGSQLARSNSALQEALSTQETFLSCVSHELKTPLTCMMGYADFLASGRIVGEGVEQTAKGILDEGRALNQLIDRILEITKLRSGKMKLDRRLTNVEAVAGEAIDRVRSVAAKKGVQVLGEFKGGPLSTMLDHERIVDALASLLSRSVDRAPEKTKVFVNTRSLGKEWAEVSIEDQGPKVPREEQSAIFRPFGEMAAAPTGRSGDLGLSLPLVQQLVMAHGGDVYAQEVGIRGLRFRVLLPKVRKLPSASELLTNDAEEVAARTS